MSEEITIETLMERMPKAFLPEKAEGVDATLQFNFTGDEPGEWAVTIRDQTCSVEKSTLEDPTLAVTVESADWIEIITGKTNAMAALAAGKVRLKGDLNLALKMFNYFDL